jgi:hypothetical protein
MRHSPLLSSGGLQGGLESRQRRPRGRTRGPSGLRDEGQALQTFELMPSCEQPLFPAAAEMTVHKRPCLVVDAGVATTKLGFSGNQQVRVLTSLHAREPDGQSAHNLVRHAAQPSFVLPTSTIAATSSRGIALALSSQQHACSSGPSSAAAQHALRQKHAHSDDFWQECFFE